MPSLTNITWERLEREGAVAYPCDDPESHGNLVIFDEAFYTSDGKGSVQPVDIVPPDEVPDDDYPMILSTGRHLEHWHTGAMTRRASVLDALEPEAVCMMHPREMRKQGIQMGDHLRVTTRRGTIEIKVRADRDVPSNMVFIPFCYAEAAANVLTNPQIDPYGKIPEFKYCAAKIERMPMEVAAE